MTGEALARRLRAERVSPQGERPRIRGVSLACFGETHRIFATKFYNTFHHRHAVLQKIKPGDVVITRTIDASGRDENGKVSGESPNPLTGPFFIEGAAPGDAIAVTFRRIRMNRNWGYSNYRPGLFSLAPGSIERLYPNTYKEGMVIPGRSNAYRGISTFSEARSAYVSPQARYTRWNFPRGQCSAA